LGFDIGYDLASGCVGSFMKPKVENGNSNSKLMEFAYRTYKPSLQWLGGIKE
jgi:hypothetical protein